MNLLRTILAALALSLAAIAPATAQDFQKGVEAAQQGDFATALREWRPLAHRGDMVAQFNLGHMYNLGLGVPKDDNEAVRWYRLSAEQGDAAAHTVLGAMYQFGEGVPEDLVAAYMWFNLAAAQGFEEAKKNKDIVAGQMTREQIAEAQSRAARCLASGYKDCDS
jgi:TPR repeat protein